MRNVSVKIGKFKDQITSNGNTGITLSYLTPDAGDFSTLDIDVTTNLDACSSTKISLWGVSVESLRKIGQAFNDLANKVEVENMKSAEVKV